MIHANPFYPPRLKRQVLCRAWRSYPLLQPRPLHLYRPVVCQEALPRPYAPCPTRTRTLGVLALRTCKHTCVSTSCCVRERLVLVLEIAAHGTWPAATLLHQALARRSRRCHDAAPTRPAQCPLCRPLPPACGRVSPRPHDGHGEHSSVITENLHRGMRGGGGGGGGGGSYFWASSTVPLRACPIHAGNRDGRMV